MADILDVAGASAGVFWICPTGGDILFRHLRSINKIRVKDASSWPASEDEIVLLRHSDANVLTQVIPELDAAQQLRFTGPAALVAFVPDKRWGKPSRIRRGKVMPRLGH